MKLLNNKVKIEIESNYYIEDEDIYIAIDGKLENKSYLQEIKKLYMEFGEKFVYKIKGFFSIYLVDKKNNILMLVKDSVGVKPIYYYLSNNCVYCSNDLMKLINTYNIKKIINTNALSMYFRYHYINPPETIFKNVYKINHGHYVIWKNSQMKDNIYWDVIESFNKKSQELVDDVNSIKKKLNDSIINFIKQITEKEEKYGIYLSGGIDSSLVTAICTKYSNKKVDTFSIGFYEDEYNEAEQARKISQYLGTKHHEIYIDKEILLKTIKKIPQYYTEPFADPSELPTIILNEFAKDNNIQIALTGDGADQLFCGCNIFDKLWKVQNMYRIVNPFHIYIPPKVLKNKRKIAYIFSNTNKKYQAQCDVLYNEIFLEGLFEDNGQKRFEEEKINTKNWQERRLIIDFDNYACNRLNIKMGTVANKNNIEIRSPFLQKELIEYSFNIPHKYKYFKRNKKYILKQILFDYIPQELFGNKKRGFDIPTQKWLQTYLNEDLKRLSTKTFIENQNIFNYEVVQNLLKNIDNEQIKNILWDYYVFQLWYEKYI